MNVQRSSTQPPKIADLHDWTTGWPMPDWVKGFRDNQWEAVEQIVDAFGRGKKYVMLDGPTGTGKTLVAETVRRVMDLKGLYLCTTRTLQDQFVTDFSYAALLKGRSNYKTINYPEGFGPPLYLSAADCDKRKVPASADLLGSYEDDYVGGQSDQFAQQEVWHCPWCDPVYKCPYEIAKRIAVENQLTCTNTAYFLTECNTGKSRFSQKFPLVICDEADTLENQLMNYVELEISYRLRRELNIPVPSIRTHTAQKAADSWAEWTAIAKSAVGRELENILGFLESKSDDLKLIRRRKSLEQIYGKLELLEEELKTGGWVYTGFERKNEDHPVIFKPVWVNTHAPKYLWTHADKFLLMSATMLSGDLTAAELGMEDGSYELITLDSTFPVKNRPVYIVPKYNLTQSTKDEALPKAVSMIDEIIERYPDDRVLVHTVSYELTNYIYENSRNRDRLIVYGSAAGRDNALKTYRGKKGAVILAPSFERGVDLPGEQCRVVIVAKMPYPYLGDKQVSARLHSKGGQAWYHLQTIRSIVQMTGRGVRSQEDWADNYILDKQFLELWKSRKNWFPKWWQDAIVWRDKGKH